MLVITNLLKNPFDEGAKVATYNLSKCLKDEFNWKIVSVNGSGKFDFIDYQVSLNRLFFDMEFYRKVKKYGDKILYLPHSSLTLASIVRARLLEWFTGAKVAIFSFQPVVYSKFTKFIIRLIKPFCVITQSNSTDRSLNRMGINTAILPLGVDTAKFTELDPWTKKKLREKFSIGRDKTVLLHVGHFSSLRNLEWLSQIKSRVPNSDVVFAASTSTPQNTELHNRLIQNGITVIADYIPRMEELYNIADYYVFPVLKKNSAIETPLSVLEAMACNLPIITTAFGSLPDVFKEDSCFHFVHSYEEVIDILRKGRAAGCNNREKIQPFGWSEVTRKLVEKLS